MKSDIRDKNMVSILMLEIFGFVRDEKRGSAKLCEGHLL